MTETTPLAPTTADAAAATERLAAWVIGALTVIVIGGVALVIYGQVEDSKGLNRRERTRKRRGSGRPPKQMSAGSVTVVVTDGSVVVKDGPVVVRSAGSWARRSPGAPIGPSCRP